jgi:hypothetical protein
LVMGIKNAILRLALLAAFLFSGNGHAVPILPGLGPLADAKGRETRFGNVSTNRSEPDADELEALAHALRWNLDSSSIGALPGKYYGPFDFLRGLYPPFGFSVGDRGMEKFVTWEDLHPGNDLVFSSDLVGFEVDDAAIAEFFATLGIDIGDWHMIIENSPMPSRHDAAPLPDGPAVSRQGHRKECLQRQREFSRKSELHDNDCFDAGGFAGFSNSIGRSRMSAIMNSSNGSPNSSNNPGGGGGGGGGSGSGGGGTSPGTPDGGGDGDNGSGSGGLPGLGTGEGEGGTGDSEVRPVPEPATLALLLLGLACVYYTRNRVR